MIQHHREHLYTVKLALVKYAQKYAQNAFGNFPKFLSIMLFRFPIMLVLCSNNNIKFLLLEYSIRVL